MFAIRHTLMLKKVSRRHLFFIVNMDKGTEKGKRGITQKLQRTEQTNPSEKTLSDTKSPYFSPRRTRNRIKIEYEQAVARSESALVAKSSSLVVPKKEKKPRNSKTKASSSDSPDIESKSSKSPKLESESSQTKSLKPEQYQSLETSTGEKSSPSNSENESLKNTKAKQSAISNQPLEKAIKAESSSADTPIEEKTSKSTKPKRLSSDQAQPEIKGSKSTKWAPENWQEIIANLKIMRKSVEAPVDTMGCDKCSDENADEKTQRFHKLVALMLSSQTRDQVTYDAMNRLKSRGLTPQNVITWSSSELEDLLVPVSFFKNKSKYLQRTAQILIDEYDSDIPNTVENLLKLPGVGPKMAHICMNTAWNVISGIGVDVHVHRISNRLKWVKKPTKEPEKTRAELEDWLPSEHWSEVNGLLVGFGQTICTPVNPKCGICLNNQICPSAQITTKSSKAKK